MPKHTPFWKFDASDWLGGSIQFTSLECKGLFIDLCALYWSSQEPVKIDTKLKVRLRCDEGTLTNLIDTLKDLEIIHVSDLGITIGFLDELFDERGKWLEKCSAAGKKSKVAKGTSSNKKEERREKKEDSRKENEEKEMPLACEFKETVKALKEVWDYPSSLAATLGGLLGAMRQAKMDDAKAAKAILKFKEIPPSDRQYYNLRKAETFVNTVDRLATYSPQAKGSNPIQNPQTLPTTEQHEAQDDVIRFPDGTYSLPFDPDHAEMKAKYEEMKRNGGI